jgi:hypothetical protein
MRVGTSREMNSPSMVKVAKKIVRAVPSSLDLKETAMEPEDDLVRGRSGYYYYKFGLRQTLVEVPFLFLHQVFFQPLLFMTGSDDPVDDYSMSEMMFLDLSYVHFNPELSNIMGNYWLLKHVLFSYDLCSDPFWKMAGNFDLINSRTAKDERVVPFWWPAAFPMISSPPRNGFFLWQRLVS